MQITRKAFLGRLIQGAAGLAGLAVVGACSSNNGGSTPDAAPASDSAAVSCTMDGTAVTIAANHGHLLMVSKADVAAATAKTYDMQGTADHTHSVTVTAEMFAKLQSNTAISVTSSTDASHDHRITVMCA